MYRHPHNTLLTLTEEFGELLHSIEQKNMNVYITQNFNIDLKKHDVDNNVLNYCDMISSYGCKHVVNGSTRVTASTASLLDHFYTNS